MKHYGKLLTLVIILSISLPIYGNSAQNRFVVLSSASDPKEKNNFACAKDFGLSKLTITRDAIFDKYFKDINFDKSLLVNRLIDKKTYDTYDISMPPILAYLISKILQEENSNLVPFKDFEDDLEKINFDLSELDWVNINRKKAYEFKIAPLRLPIFSYPRDIKTIFLQRGYLNAQQDVIDALDILTKFNFDGRRLKEALIFGNSRLDDALNALIFESWGELNTSLVGIYDTQTGRIFISDFMGSGEYILIPIGNVYIDSDYENYGYVSIGLDVAIPSLCWCHVDRDAISSLSKEEIAMLKVTDFLSSFSLKENVITPPVEQVNE